MLSFVGFSGFASIQNLNSGRRIHMQQNRLTKDNALVKIKSLAKLSPDASIASMANNTKYGPVYKFNPKGQVMFPLEEFLLYRNGYEIAQIDMRPLLAYPQHEHHIHTKTYNQKSPFEDTQQTQIIINFMPFPGISSQGIPIKLTFIDAEITHDTQLFFKMDPYVKVKVNDADKWKSKTANKGDKFPNFNREYVNLNLRSMNDTVSIQLWDDDRNRDDFIGQVMLKGFEFLARGQEVLEYPIVYQKKQKIVPAGKIRFQVETPGLN